MARTDVKVSSERNPSTHDDEKRSRKFRAPLLFALLVVPAFGLLLRFIVFWAPEMLWLVAGLSLTTGFIYASAAVAIGYKVSKRIPLVIWHVAATGFLFGLALYITTVIRWPAETAPWYHRLLAVVNWPAWWVIVHLFGAVIVGGSWLLYRIDAFRAATGADEFDGGALAKFLKFPAGAKVVESSIVADEYAIEAEISHPGVPVEQIQASLKPIVEYAGAVRGRSSVIAGEKGGESRMRIVLHDPLEDWKRWPGLSHPGGSFAHPFRTAYYTNGKEQLYSFAKTPAPEDLPVSRIAPDFRSANDAHFGRQGATRAGKSGDNSIEVAEALSRTDVVVCFVNTAKLAQDAGWALEFAKLAADTKPKANLLFAKLQEIGEWRSKTMGRAGHRTWTPRTFRELGIPAILLEVDEGDTVLNAGIATWLATKGLSLGIYLSTTISRAMTDGMASTLRSAIVQWKAFGAGQDYDAGFAITDETIAAGANVAALGTAFPGAHYADRLNGVDKALYPELARSYQGEQDFSDLLSEVRAARQYFTPADFTRAEWSILGDAAGLLSPAAVMDDSEPNPGSGNTEMQLPKGKTVEQTMASVDEDGDRMGDTGDPEVDALLAKPRQDFSELEREYGALPAPNEPLPDRSVPGAEKMQLEGDGRPAWGPKETDAEFDAALVRLAQRGKREIGNPDVMDEMRCEPRPDRVSKRFKAMCEEGEVILQPPPGVTLARLARGRFALGWVSPPAPDAGS